MPIVTSATPTNLAPASSPESAAASIASSSSSVLASAAGAGSAGLTFPSDLGNYGYWMTLGFQAYQVPAFYTNNPGGAVTSPLGSVRLPLPNYMVDSQLVVYDQEALSLALGAGLSAIKNGGGVSGAAGAAVTGLVTQGAQTLGRTAAAALGQSANAPEAALQATGYTINPFMTVMFKTPAYKKHSLSWKLSPKNAQESQTLNSIIAFLKMNQLPNLAYGGVLLSYPNIVNISVSNAPTSYFTYLFKSAVIETCAVNYTPAGQPSFFTQTQAPGEVEIALSILEIEFWLQPDFNGGQVAANPIPISAGTSAIVGAPFAPSFDNSFNPATAAINTQQ